MHLVPAEPSKQHARLLLQNAARANWKFQGCALAAAIQTSGLRPSCILNVLRWKQNISEPFANLEQGESCSFGFLFFFCFFFFK